LHLGGEATHPSREGPGELSVADGPGEPVVPAAGGVDVVVDRGSEGLVRSAGQDGEQDVVVNDDHAGNGWLLVSQIRVFDDDAADRLVVRPVPQKTDDGAGSLGRQGRSVGPWSGLKFPSRQGCAAGSCHGLPKIRTEVDRADGHPYTVPEMPGIQGRRWTLRSGRLPRVCIDKTPILLVVSFGCLVPPADVGLWPSWEPPTLPGRSCSLPPGPDRSPVVDPPAMRAVAGW
jgi:hypothetical protein